MIVVIVYSYFFIFFFKQKTAYEMRISDWSSDVCSSDLSSLQRASRPSLTGPTRSRRPPRAAAPAAPASAPDPRESGTAHWYRRDRHSTGRGRPPRDRKSVV